jgi:hypothetical protein
MPHQQPNKNKVHALATTLIVKPGGQFLTFPDIRLQWRPAKKGVTTAESFTPVGATPCLLKRLRSKGRTVATTFALNASKGQKVEALAKEQRPREDELTHVLLRVVIRTKQCSVARVRVHNGHAAAFEAIANPELFSAPIGSLVRVEFTDGRSAELTLGRETTCRVVPNPLDSEWTVTAVAPERNRLTQAEHAKRGQEKCIKRPGSRRGRHFRRHAGPAQKAFARH